MTRLLSVAGIFLVALCLRPALTSVGPVLPQVGADLWLGESALGVLGALPLLAFAVVSPQVHRVSRRFGMERAVLAALLVLAVGTTVRSWTGPVGLWVGTVVIGCAIAVGNVLVPAIVKRDFASDVSRATGFYTAFMTLAASLASAVAVPVSDAADWRLSLGIWGVLAIAVAAAWAPRARYAPEPEPKRTGAEVAVWRQPRAWLITAFMGLQSTCFYVLVTWLPTIEITNGVPERTAGLHLFLYQGLGILGGLTIPLLLRSRPRAGAVAASLPVIIAVTGLLVAPGAAVLWAGIGGLGQGAGMVTALTLISLSGSTPAETTRLSGMAQSFGYLFATAGPIAAGVLAERTGGWTATLVMLLALGILQVTAGAAAGRNRSPERTAP